MKNGKKRGSGKPTPSENIVLATAIISLIIKLIELIEKLFD